MQVPVEIKLKTVQTQAGEIEKFELFEQGELTRKGETVYLRYTEAKAGAQTILKIKPAELLLTRRQKELALQLNLAEGQQTNAKYKTAYGVIPLAVKCTTYKYEQIAETSGELRVEYLLYSGEELLGEYKLELQFKA